jgi:hypothetical protein
MAVIALALVAGGAQAQEAGWDTKMGAVFGIGVDGDPMADYNGKVGLQYNLGPQAALRLGLNLSRESCGDAETKIGTVTVTSVCGGGDQRGTGTMAPPGFLDARTGFVYNSGIGLNLSAEYLMRASTAAVSPYFGAGAYIDFQTASLKGEDKTDVAGDTIYEYNNKETVFGLGLLGKAGVEWRINKVIALFAEYQLNINLIESAKINYEETDDTTVSKSETTVKNIFNLGTGIANGGLVGITAFF